MTYSSIDNVFSSYRPINTLVGSADDHVTSGDVTSVFINNADSLIDSYLAKKYVVPVASPPYMIRQISVDISIFDMMVEKLPEVPDFMQARYDRSMAKLQMLADGEIVLVGGVEVSSQDSYAWSSTSGYHTIFDPSLDAIDQAVDKDQVDAAKDAREGDQGYDSD